MFLPIERIENQIPRPWFFTFLASWCKLGAWGDLLGPCLHARCSVSVSIQPSCLFCSASLGQPLFTSTIAKGRHAPEKWQRCSHWPLELFITSTIGPSRFFLTIVSKGKACPRKMAEVQSLGPGSVWKKQPSRMA